MKKTVCIILALIIGIFSLAQFGMADEVYTRGDVNEDGTIDATDLLLIRYYFVKNQTNINLTLADANEDNSIDLKDVLLIRKHLSNNLNQELGTVIQPDATSPADVTHVEATSNESGFTNHTLEINLLGDTSTGNVWSCYTSLDYCVEIEQQVVTPAESGTKETVSYYFTSYDIGSDTIVFTYKRENSNYVYKEVYYDISVDATGNIVIDDIRSIYPGDYMTTSCIYTTKPKTTTTTKYTGPTTTKEWSNNY